MKIWQTATVLSLGLLLAGCGGQQSAKSSSMSMIKASSQSKTGVKIAWDEAKAKKLAAFMQDFGTTMNQSYIPVSATTHAQWQGTDLAEIYKANKPVNVAGKTTPMTWLPADGQASKTQPNVVAVYVDDADKILYLFTLTANGQAQALVSQAAANADVLTVKQTANTDLASGYQAIAAGQAASAENSQSGSQPASSSDSPDAGAASQHAAANAASSDAVFDSSYQHKWYTYDDPGDGTSELHTCQFAANESIYDGEAEPVYPISMRTAADQAALNGDPSKMDPKKEKWGAATSIKADDGSHWINVRGWYQSAGDGGYYRVVNRNLDGQSVPVLEDAYGAGIWHGSNYFLSPALAQKYKNIIYSDEHKQE
ncbi:DUF4767 domain-containing protein [Lacticaseibacillus baoqingensis]|uniref:DUF4767 domain-containing protein n=1 Tax=Lacticaseibacillus baoqingensis TaxID=2486013 RepID=A0ABW4E5T4_9LACO|nr:DUF4767 domain-containing protein [Lacticaseibacillus baoqingensis]